MRRNLNLDHCRLPRLVFLLALPVLCHAQVDQQEVEQFARSFAAENDLNIEEVRTSLNKAVFRPEIIEKMERPAEAMPWYRYRKIFLTDERTEGGVAFWRTYEEVLKQVSEESGVPVEIIVAIIGVETYYGRVKGDHKVLDALYTLAFGYPKREGFFKRELREYLLLAAEEGLSLEDLNGSYAGAMGYCQFMPSSYRAYAKSYDDGGNADLVSSPEDAIASVANYLQVHRWKNGETIVSKAVVSPTADDLPRQSLKPSRSLSYFSEKGYASIEQGDLAEPVTLVQLELEEEKEFWIASFNFYVITRYNRSPLYAMAVYQLGEAIRAKINPGTG